MCCICGRMDEQADFEKYVGMFFSGSGQTPTTDLYPSKKRTLNTRTFCMACIKAIKRIPLSSTDVYVPF